MSWLDNTELRAEMGHAIREMESMGLNVLGIRKVDDWDLYRNGKLKIEVTFLLKVGEYEIETTLSPILKEGQRPSALRHAIVAVAKGMCSHDEKSKVISLKDAARRMGARGGKRTKRMLELE